MEESNKLQEIRRMNEKIEEKIRVMLFQSFTGTHKGERKHFDEIMKVYRRFEHKAQLGERDFSDDFRKEVLNSLHDIDYWNINADQVFEAVRETLCKRLDLRNKMEMYPIECVREFFLEFVQCVMNDGDYSRIFEDEKFVSLHEIHLALFACRHVIEFDRYFYERYEECKYLYRIADERLIEFGLMREYEVEGLLALEEKLNDEMKVAKIIYEKESSIRAIKRYIEAYHHNLYYGTNLYLRNYKIEDYQCYVKLVEELFLCEKTQENLNALIEAMLLLAEKSKSTGEKLEILKNVFHIRKKNYEMTREDTFLKEMLDILFLIGEIQKEKDIEKAKVTYTKIERFIEVHNEGNKNKEFQSYLEKLKEAKKEIC